MNSEIWLTHYKTNFRVIRIYYHSSASLNICTVYRDNTKGDKNRKSGVDRNVSLSKGKAKEGEPVSAPSRVKGKAKAALPPPFTTQPRSVGPSSAPYATEDVNMSGLIGGNEDVGEGEGEGEGDVGGDYDSAGPVADEVEDYVDYETDEEDMDVVDESEELRRDTAGIDEVDPGENSQM